MKYFPGQRFVQVEEQSLELMTTILLEENLRIQLEFKGYLGKKEKECLRYNLIVKIHKDGSS